MVGAAQGGQEQRQVEDDLCGVGARGSWPQAGVAPAAQGGLGPRAATQWVSCAHWACMPAEAREMCCVLSMEVGHRGRSAPGEPCVRLSPETQGRLPAGDGEQGRTPFLVLRERCAGAGSSARPADRTFQGKPVPWCAAAAPGAWEEGAAPALQSHAGAVWAGAHRVDARELLEHHHHAGHHQLRPAAPRPSAASRRHAPPGFPRPAAWACSKRSGIQSPRAERRRSVVYRPMLPCPGSQGRLTGRAGHPAAGGRACTCA